jgi:AraC-like DNA-binding protein
MTIGVAIGSFRTYGADGGKMNTICRVSIAKFLLFLSDAVVQFTTHIGNTSLSIEFLAEQLHMSRSSLYRKIRATSSYSPYEIIEQVRLKRAAALMHEGRFKINEIAHPYRLFFSITVY